MQTTFEKAIEVIRRLSEDDLAKLNEWLANRETTDSSEESVAASADRQSIYEKRMDWLKANRAQYGGQYVVLDGDRLLGTAKNYPEGRKIAAQAGVSDAFINYLSRPDEEGFTGGW